MKLTIGFVCCALALVGCNEAKRPLGSTATSEGTPPRDADTGPQTSASNSKPAENSGINVRDREGAAKTPLDQNENQADINVTAEIRKRVIAAKLSIDAQNCKIITQDGKVTLRGPVKTADEKQQIQAIAEQVAGPDRVDNQLEVAANG